MKKINDAARDKISPITLQDFNLIAYAIKKYSQDNQDRLPLQILTKTSEISSDEINICSILVPKYMPFLPKSPSFTATGELEKMNDKIVNCSSEYRTRYYVRKSLNGNSIVLSAGLGIEKIYPITE